MKWFRRQPAPEPVHHLSPRELADLGDVCAGLPGRRMWILHYDPNRLPERTMERWQWAEEYRP
jgi:hypothetical protein